MFPIYHPSVVRHGCQLLVSSTPSTLISTNWGLAAPTCMIGNNYPLISSEPTLQVAMRLCLSNPNLSSFHSIITCWLYVILAHGETPIDINIYKHVKLAHELWEEATQETSLHQKTLNEGIIELWSCLIWCTINCPQHSNEQERRDNVRPHWRFHINLGP